MDFNFPFPFRGITHRLFIADLLVTEVIEHLVSGCGHHHSHNFAIETDARDGSYIYTTYQGMACINEFMLRDKD